jgi:HPt (histidine-containing phosphotransfer) domain-containing protein
MIHDGTAVVRSGEVPGAAGEDEGFAVEQPPVDQTVIEQLASITDLDGSSVLGELLNAFLGAVPGRLDGLDRAVAAGDRTAVGDQAHALTGSAASFGARGMADMCRELRVAAIDGNMAVAADLVRALHAEFDRVREWLVEFGRNV